MNTKTVYVVYGNSDLTEGRGNEYLIAACEIEETAHRIGRGRYVQGTDCPVYEMSIVNIDGKWYVPGTAILMISPSNEDWAAHNLAHARRAALAKAKAAGLSDEEIKLLES